MGTKAVGGANGKAGHVVFYNSNPPFNGSYELCVTEWNLTENVAEEDTTNSCSEGKREFDYGVKWVEGRFTLDLDLSAHPLDDPPNLRAGQTIDAALNLFEHATTMETTSGGTNYWILTNPQIISVDITTPATGKITYVINFKASSYTFTIQSISA